MNLNCVNKVKESAVVISFELQNRLYITSLLGKIYSKVLRVIRGKKWSYVRSCQHVIVEPQNNVLYLLIVSITLYNYFKNLKVQCLW